MFRYPPIGIFITIMALKVLLADDHEEFRKTLLEYLQTQGGIEIVGEASNGTEALERTIELHPDVVLMDMSMPHVTGIEATRAIKKQLPNTKIIILSVHSAIVYERLARDSGADGFIGKDVMKSGLMMLLDPNGGRFLGTTAA